ncbi:hypothetical protein K7I13_08835 [Brucepastera parasyntrophica]|uniref:hypothetical protein n=1 Tax=Brucepastera parasyntrophica TaxID=2880008 RepID=UPI00210C2505|nr:hypothetical protein [Brucepastera parasyntrophica]ULQ58664.1 hypothetical protein K7I13_08835 [Brucepastera parasyntrophica]
MKKTLLVAALAVMVLAKAVQAQAVDIDQLVKDFQAGNITMEEYIKGIQEHTAEFQRQQLQGALDEAKQNQTAIDASDASVFPSDRFVQLHDELYTLAAARNDGRMNTADYETRAKPLSDEIERIINNDGRPMSQANGARYLEAGEAVRKLWPGQQPGWPPAEGRNSIREVCDLGPFTQPSGTRASYSYSFPGAGSELGSIRIYITGNTNAIYREMRSQIERISGRKMESKPDDSYGTQNLEIYMPKGSFPLDRYIYLGITKDNAVLVEFQRRFSSRH